MDTHSRVPTLTNFHAHTCTVTQGCTGYRVRASSHTSGCAAFGRLPPCPRVQEPRSDRSCFPGLIRVGARVGGLPRSDALSCWTNLLYLFLSESSSPRSAFPASLHCVSYLAFFPPIYSVSAPCLFSLPGPAPCLCPTLSAGAFHSPVRSWSERSRTRFQLRLRGGQLLPGHRRPSHRQGAEALGDLDLRVAQTRALLYRQPPPGEGREMAPRTPLPVPTEGEGLGDPVSCQLSR